MASHAQPRSKRINIRASVQEEELMKRGAVRRGKTLTEFIVESACTEAAELLTDQTVFLLPPEQWKAFVKALDRPPRVRPKLRELFAESTVLDRSHS